MKLKLVATAVIFASMSTASFALTCKPLLTVNGSGINGITAEADAYLNWRNTAESMYGAAYKNWVLAKNRGRSTHKVKFGKWTAQAYGEPCKL